jgi:hypothetical protein
MNQSSTYLSQKIELPIGLMAATTWMDTVLSSSILEFSVPASYETLLEGASGGASGGAEVVAIQRLLTLARLGARFRVLWDSTVVKKVVAGPSIFPLLAILFLIPNSEHSATEVKDSDILSQISRDRVRRAILGHKLARDFFADSDILVCADGSGEPLPVDLYQPKTRRLITREDFETLVVDALAAQMGGGSNTAMIYSSASALGTIVAELFENTEMHGKLDLVGKPLRDSFRGLMFKRLKIEVPVLQPRPGEAKKREVDCFEVSVFDAGIGYFASYTRARADIDTPLVDEWKVLHNCLERHFYPELQDHRSGHRALGLYEVLRAIQALKGRIEIRTGRLFAYRTFLDGQLQAQMRPRAAYAHLAWPVPKLLDTLSHRSKPTGHELLVGSSVRIIVPLGV